MEDRWNYLVELDEQLLKGGVILSEWCTTIVKETDFAFVNKAHLAAIITAVAGIETYLRSEYESDKKMSLFKLIDSSTIDQNLKEELHSLRKYRNKWVHVEEPWDDEEILTHPENYEQELEKMAFYAVKLLRKTIYENPWI